MIERLNSSSDIAPMLSFCRKAHDDNRPAAENMYAYNWETNPANVLNKMYKQKLFDGPSAGYIVYKENDEILCGIGFYRSKQDPNIIVTGVRAYTLPGIFKHKIIGILSHMSLDIAREQGAKGTILTFNEYNLDLMETALAINIPSKWPNYYRDETGNHYREKDIRIMPMRPSGPYNIEHTKQWITYHLFELDYEEQFLSNMSQYAWLT